MTPTDGGFRLRLDMPAYGVASGQAAVLYEGEAVVGAGRSFRILPNLRRPWSV